jgi:hypothetical protein
MTDEQLEAKFMSLAVDTLSETRARQLIRQCRKIESLEDVGDLTKLGVPS